VKPPAKPPSRNAPNDKAYAAPTPKVSRLKKGRVLTPAEKAAFLASRPDLKNS
jgi:hypothetical protein